MSPRAQKQLAGRDNASKRPEPARIALPAQPARPSPPQPGTDPRDLQLEVASYIEMLSAELRSMAKAVGLGGLAYFLEMARLEASIQVERHAATIAEG